MTAPFNNGAAAALRVSTPRSDKAAGASGGQVGGDRNAESPDFAKAAATTLARGAKRGTDRERSDPLARAGGVSGLDRMPTSSKRVPDLYAMPTFVALTEVAQRALVALWSAAETNITGLVNAPGARLAPRLRVGARRIAAAMAELEHAGFVVTCAETDTVALVRHVEMQLGGEPMANPQKWGVATARTVARMPKSALTTAFCEHYQLPEKLPKGGPKQGAKDRLSHRVSDRVSDTVPDTAYLSVKEQRGETHGISAALLRSGGDDVSAVAAAHDADALVMLPAAKGA